MPASHDNWFNTCLLQVIPVDDGKAGALALARQINDQDASRWEPLVLLLTKRGEAVARSDWLPIATCGNGGQVALAGDGAALVVVTQRDLDYPKPIVDVPHWFAATWRGGKIKVEEIGCWNDVSLGAHIRGTTTSTGTVWVGAYYPEGLTKPAGYRETRLLLGESQGCEVPAHRLTEVECVDMSHPVPFGDEFYVLVTARFERIELWAFDRQLNVRKVLELEHSKKNVKQSLGPSRLARCGDALLMFWGLYTDRVGAKKPRTWQGLLRAASYDSQSKTASKIIDATPDPRVVAATLEAHPIEDSVVVTWESRPKRGGGGMRALRCASLDELPRDAVALSQKDSPLFIPRARGPILRSGRNPESSSWAIEDEIPSR